MESLAYSIIKLLRGTLPWKGANRAEQLSIKATWTGPKLCGGYSPVFGEFLEYTRGMQFEEAPNYAGWSARFRSLVSVEDEPLLYNSSDRNPPLAGSIFGSVSPPLSQSDLDPPPDSEDEDSLPDSDDGWVPTSSWPAPERIKEEDLLGNEKEVIARELEIFDMPPEMDEPYLQCTLPEIMEPLYVGIRNNV